MTSDPVSGISRPVSAPPTGTSPVTSGATTVRDTVLTLPDSMTLHAAGTDLGRSGRAVAHACDTDRRQWTMSTHLGLHGSAFSAARRREEDTAVLRRTAAELITGTASVLLRVAEAQATLEAELDRILREAVVLGLSVRDGRFVARTEEGFTVADVLNDAVDAIKREGILLDRHCSRRLETFLSPGQFNEDRRRCVETLNDLYTPSPPGMPLPATGDLSAAELHRINMRDASPELAALTGEFPGMVVLETGDRHLVAAFGDIDSASSVTTMVSGVTSATPGEVPGVLERGRELQRELGGAVIVWNGYEAPETLVDGAGDIPAELGAVAFRTFMHSLSERCGPGVVQSVVAHSYGSLLVGMAASGENGGLDADNIMFLGSPGTGAATVDDLRLRSPDGRIAASRGTWDPVGLLVSERWGWHGPDPADPAFGAEVVPSTGGHSGYFTEESVLGVLRDMQHR
ncbi:alpha/beta hydrolase [Corynebacterium sp. P7003]|uniref:Alpha/beta hydrolase n=1 Tax=Corynebacterium pygosceleis TaxID=2800406 RepID=A0ABT3WU49_9CORY|nr:alpha/beta hydrolase [Corynebacterium pygosceleis]MCX7445686.1 alpha/beta hydrolase [Corynebacterium pygosceleis]